MTVSLPPKPSKQATNLRAEQPRPPRLPKRHHLLSKPKPSQRFFVHLLPSAMSGPYPRCIPRTYSRTYTRDNTPRSIKPRRHKHRPRNTQRNIPPAQRTRSPDITHIPDPLNAGGKRRVAITACCCYGGDEGQPGGFCRIVFLPSPGGADVDGTELTVQ